MDIRNEGFGEVINRNRDFMKFPNSETFLIIQNTVKSDQTKELPQPPIGRICEGEIIELQSDFEHEIKNNSYMDLLDIRRSERVFDANNSMTQTQLAFILWSSQGIQKNIGITFRPVPSGGGLHPFELYFIVRSVEGLKQGVYRYAPLEHIGEKRVAVEFKGELNDLDTKISDLFLKFPPKNASVILLLSCVPYRKEWRYGYLAHRPILMDLGHVGQNIMLSSTAMGLGSCCYAAYDQDLCDKILGIDGHEEFTIYVCAVGNINK
jgi:SagB-type dehydrogenase family enzyme